MNNNELLLDKEEQDWLESVENDEWQTTGNLHEIEKKFKSAIVNHRKRKTISVSFDINDLYKIKRLSAENGFTPQTIINALVHNYVNGKISLQL